MPDVQEKITLILNWAEENPGKGFDTMFVVDLQEKLDEWGELKPAQEDALDNIISRWGIE